MTRLSLPAPAKLNLFLHVLGRRGDGYHELQTAFRILDFGDTVHLDTGAEVICMDTPTPGVDPEDDLALRAARALARAAGVRRGAGIRIDKRIPAGAGLGGGSSDAAAVLVGLNRLWGLELDPAELAGIALDLGADVPVFAHGRDAWGEGVGEMLSPLGLPPAWYVIVIPRVHVATARVFGDAALRRDRAAVSPRHWLAQREGFGNDCLPVVCRLYPQIEAAAADLAGYGRARLSGTGSALFLEFDDPDRAREVGNALGGRYNTIVTRAAGSG